MVEVTEAFLLQMVSAMQTSASAMEAAARAQEAVAAELRAMRDEHADGRAYDAADVKAHISAEVNAREKWWRAAFTLAASALVLASLFSVPLSRVLAVLKLPGG